MIELIQLLNRRLEDRGIEGAEMPLFTKDVINTISMRPGIGLEEINRRLHLLGWNFIELDDQTLQLFMASFEQSN